MTEIGLSTVSIVDERPAKFAAADGTALAGTWFEPSRPRIASTVVVIVCGAGIPARFYHHFARYLCERGAAVLTFDYRGIGASRQGNLRKLKSGMEHWAVQDIPAAFSEARTRYSRVPLGAVAHSVGTLLLGAASEAARIERLIFFGPHTGYWRDYRARWRWLMYGVWHVSVPTVTKLVGYFPGKRLRLGEDLPPQVALDWAGRRRPELGRSAEEARRYRAILSRHREIRAKTLVLSITDDAFAPPAAARRVLSLYPNLIVTHETIAPASLGCRRLGHFGFLRRPASEFFWCRAAAWLIAERVDDDSQMAVHSGAPYPPPPGV
ncbi:MAG TPA: alpha/beta fold hydrolase [Casimicrobiaceae bacterium]